jgi:hypothetical protein
VPDPVFTPLASVMVALSEGAAKEICVGINAYAIEGGVKSIGVKLFSSAPMSGAVPVPV